MVVEQNGAGLRLWETMADTHVHQVVEKCMAKSKPKKQTLDLRAPRAKKHGHHTNQEHDLKK